MKGIMGAHRPEGLRVAIVGFGYWGPNLVRNFTDNDYTNVSMICDLDVGRREAARRRYPGIEVTGSYGDVCNSSSVDLVVIATPISTHYDLAKRALIGGKDVFVEKPLCTSSTQAQDLLDTANELGRRVFVDHTFVYNPAVRAMKNLIKDKNFGKPLYYDSVRGNLGLFQSDINVLWDLAPHDLSILDYVLDGELPESVSCVGSAHFEGTENIAYVSMVYTGGFIAHFHLNWLAPVKIRQILFGGSKKMLVYDDVNPTEKIRLYDKGVDLPSGSLQASESHRVQYRVGDVYAPFVANTESLKIEVDHIVACYVDDVRPLTGIEAGVNVVRILEAADYSMKNGGQPVRLAEKFVASSL